MAQRKDYTIWILLAAYLVFVCFLVMLGLSCNPPKDQETVKLEEVATTFDSILVKSQENLQHATLVQHKSDSVVHVKVIRKIQELRQLNNLVSELSAPQPRLMMSPPPPEVVYVTDTVYIEIQKNFWGRKKVKTYRKVDSTYIEINPQDTTAVADSVHLQ